MILSPRDQKIIETIGQTRAISFPLLLAAFPPNQHLIETNKQNGQASGQYLERTRLPFLIREGYLHRTGDLYTLADGGAKFLREKGISFYGVGGEGRKYINGARAWQKHAEAIAESMRPEGQGKHLLFRSEIQIRIRAALPVLDWFHAGEKIYTVRVPVASGGISKEATVIPDDQVHLPPHITESGREKPHIIHIEAEWNLKAEKEATTKLMNQLYLYRSPEMRGTHIQFVYVLPRQIDCDLMAARWQKLLKKIDRKPDDKVMNFLTLDNLSLLTI